MKNLDIKQYDNGKNNLVVLLREKLSSETSLEDFLEELDSFISKADDYLKECEELNQEKAIFECLKKYCAPISAEHAAGLSAIILEDDEISKNAIGLLLSSNPLLCACGLKLFKHMVQETDAKAKDFSKITEILVNALGTFNQRPYDKAAICLKTLALISMRFDEPILHLILPSVQKFLEEKKTDFFHEESFVYTSIRSTKLIVLSFIAACGSKYETFKPELFRTYFKDANEYFNFNTKLSEFHIPWYWECLPIEWLKKLLEDKFCLKIRGFSNFRTSDSKKIVTFLNSDLFNNLYSCDFYEVSSFFFDILTRNHWEKKYENHLIQNFFDFYFISQKHKILDLCEQLLLLGFNFSNPFERMPLGSTFSDITEYPHCFKVFGGDMIE